MFYAAWLAGLAALLGAGGVGGINSAGFLLLVLLFLPMFGAYRRDRLSFPMFACFFLPAWSWAMCKAMSPADR